MVAKKSMVASDMKRKGSKGSWGIVGIEKTDKIVVGGGGWVLEEGV